MSIRASFWQICYRGASSPRYRWLCLSEGDWVVDNEGDVYTVDADVFKRTYRQTGPGIYVKTTPVWAERASCAGSVQTKEGVTHYDAGDYIVSNSSDGADDYAIAAEKFESLYTRADEDA